MVVTAVLVYVPPLATFFGNEVIIPSQIWRVAWPIPLAALMTFGWFVWRATLHAAKRFNERGLPGHRARYLPVLVIAFLMVAVTPLAVAGARTVYEASIPTAVLAYPDDPIFDWIGNNIKEPSLMLAPDAENTAIPAYSASVDVISLRGGAILNNLEALEQRAEEGIEIPRRVLDVQKFYSNPTLEEGLGILRRYEVDYVMVYADSDYEDQLKQLPGFELIDTPSGRYGLLAVDL